MPIRNQAVTPVYEVIVRNRDNNDLFMLIACDGIWDVMDTNEAMQFVFLKLSEGFQKAENNAIMRQQIVAETCDSIIFECLQRGSRDNLSVISVEFSYSGILQTNIVYSQSHQVNLQDLPIMNSPTASDMISSENPGSDVQLMDVISSNYVKP